MIVPGCTIYWARAACAYTTCASTYWRSWGAICVTSFQSEKNCDEIGNKESFFGRFFLPCLGDKVTHLPQLYHYRQRMHAAFCRFFADDLLFLFLCKLHASPWSEWYSEKCTFSFFIYLGSILSISSRFIFPTDLYAALSFDLSIFLSDRLWCAILNNETEKIMYSQVVIVLRLCVCVHENFLRIWNE